MFSLPAIAQTPVAKDVRFQQWTSPTAAPVFRILNGDTSPGKFPWFTAAGVLQASPLALSDTGAIAFPDGVRQTFNPSGTIAGFNFGAHTADPSSPLEGDCYVNSTSHTARIYLNGAWAPLGSGSSNGDVLAANNLSEYTPTASTARANIGLGNVSNTSDANKPVSTAQQTALDLKAPLASPTFTGTGAAANWTCIPANTDLITEGDSRTAIAGGSISAGLEWPAKLITMSSFTGRVTLYNTAVGGSTVVSMAARYAASVYPHRPAVTGKHAILTVFCGGNPIASDISAATVEADLAAYCTTARADGFEVWMMTDVTRASFNLAQHAQYGELNRLIRAGTYWDRIIDIGSAFPDPLDLTFFQNDGLHFTAGGCLRVAELVNQNAQLPYSRSPVQGSAADLARLRSTTANFDSYVRVATSGLAGTLTVGLPSGSAGNIIMLPETTQGSDYSLLGWYVRGSGADTGARAWQLAANYDEFGALVFQQSASSTTAPTLTRLKITPAGNVEVSGALNVGGTTTLGGHLLFTDNTYDIGASGATRPRTLYLGTSAFSPRYDVATSVGWRAGTGSPESAVTANIGSLYSRTDGSANTSLYRKESGTGNTGWVAVANGSGSGTVTSVDVSGGTTGLTSSGGAVTTSGTITLAGVLVPANGGTLQKPRVDAVADANISTLSTEQTIDSMTTNASVVLLTAQTTASQNGPWVTSSGAWARPAWYTTGSTVQAVQGSNVDVINGTNYSGTTWFLTTSGTITIGTTSTAWSQNPVNLPSTVGNLAGSRVAAGVNASVVTAGTMAADRISTGTSGAFDGAAITNLSAANLAGNIAVARISNALTTPGAIGGTTASTGAFTAITGSSVSTTGGVTAYNATAVPAGGTAGSGFKFSSTSNLGIFFGSGAPTLSAAQGSIYLRTDGAPYYNNNGTTGWTSTAAGSGTVTTVGWTGGIVSVANATTTPAFTIAGTSGGVPYFDSSSTWATSAALASNTLMVGGGAGAAPKSVTSEIISFGSGARVMTAAAMGALSIDVTKINNTKSISADSTVTFSGTPASTTTFFGVTIKNTDTASHTVTWPGSFSMDRQTTAAHVTTVPASGRLDVQVKYDGTDYTLFGDAVTINDLTVATVDTAADKAQFYDATDSLHKGVLIQNLFAGSGATMEFGATSDTTVSRPSAGDLNIEGNRIYRAGGTDVAVADGGTGLSSGTSGGVLAFTASGTIASSAALAANAIVIGGGSGVAPSTTTTGTGVLTGLGNTTNAAGGFMTTDGTKSPTNTTLDAAATGNILKFKNYIYLTHPHLADGTNATIGTTATAIGYGHATFSNSVDKASNYVEYYIQVPEDIDTSVALRARLKISLGGADTAKQGFRISSVSVADSAIPTASTLANEISINFAGDASGASGDVETSSWTTLTSWAGALTAGQTWRVRLARDGDDGTDDTSTVNCTELGLVLEYGVTQ